MVHGDFILGLPGETAQTVAVTAAFIRRTRPNILQVAVASPIPGTPFFRWARDNGYLLTEDMARSLDSRGYQRCIISYPGLPSAAITSAVDRALRQYYLRPSFLPVAMSNILRRGGLGELKLMLRAASVLPGYLRRAA